MPYGIDHAQWGGNDFGWNIVPINPIIYNIIRCFSGTNEDLRHSKLLISIFVNLQKNKEIGLSTTQILFVRVRENDYSC